MDDLPSLVWSGTNAARRVLNCDRVSLLIRHGRTWQLRCVSGVDTIDRRSTSVKMLERLANQTPDGHQSIWLDGSDSEVACDPSESSLSTDSPAARYRNNTGANVLGILPLSNIGLLVVEHFASPDGAELKHAAEQIAEELTPLLILLQRADQLPLISLSRFLNRRGLQGWRSLSSGRWLLFVVAAGLLAMVLCWPADFEVEARGELQPAEQQFVYAPRDGVVTGFPAAAAASGTAAMRAEQDHTVHTGQVVMQLQNSGLDYQITQILGEQQTTSRRLDTVTVLLEQLARSANPDQSQFSQLTAEKLELEIQQESLLRQLEILRAERQALAITANISGEIQTWDFVSRLRSRPVRQGSHLMTIANVEGAWRLELQIPDRSMTDIHAAQKQLGEELRIRFLVRSAPDQHFTTQLSRLAKTTRYADSHGLSVQAVAELNRTAVPPNARPGTAVVARIYCGQRSLAFVWLHDLVRTVRQRLLL